MAVIFTRQRVRGYDAFRRVYDGGSAMRTAAGVFEGAIYRAEGDPTTIAIRLRFASLAEAHAFSENAALRDVLAQAGIEAASRRVEFYEES